MKSTYVARVTVKDKGALSEIERILNTSSFSKPNLYAVSSSMMTMLVSPYEDGNGGEVRSFEVTDYLVEQGLLPEDTKERGPVTQEMAQAVLNRLERKSPRVELYRVSATDVIPDRYDFFKELHDIEHRGSGPFFNYEPRGDLRPFVITTNSLFGKYQSMVEELATRQAQQKQGK